LLSGQAKPFGLAGPLGSSAVIIAVACDHAGLPLKRPILDAVRGAGHEPLDLGTDSEAPVDYPDFAAAVGRAIQKGNADGGFSYAGRA
jgi:ribose 5-phosphate isomerase B